MWIYKYIQLQITQIREGGTAELHRKLRTGFKKGLMFPVNTTLLVLAFPVVMVIRLIRPWFLVRWEGLISNRIGHFSGNTELYLCEYEAGINKPRQRHIDLFYMAHKPICNKQLAIMWKRILRVWPKWILFPVRLINKWIPGGRTHEIGNNTQQDRDVHNLTDRFPPFIKFTEQEKEKGERGLREIGIPKGSPFVCLLVRDNSYLKQFGSGWSYHDYRDCDIQNFILASEELANRGYYVIRMGEKVKEALKTDNPKIIDYASNGMRNDFMDIYLGAKCTFVISTGAGWDWVPGMLFRKPVVFPTLVPLGNIVTCSNRFLVTTKKHVFIGSGEKLTLREIFTHKIAFSTESTDFETKRIQLIENTQEEIRDVVVEMAERLNGTWQPHPDD